MKRKQFEPLIYFTKYELKEIIAFLVAYDYILENRLKIKNNKKLKLWIQYLCEQYEVMNK